jgi:hypothetical protein
MKGLSHLVKPKKSKKEQETVSSKAKRINETVI